AEEGTWYSNDRFAAILLQGLSPDVNDLADSEDAYWTWNYCLAAQPNPKQRDIDLILKPEVVPKKLLDRDTKLWRLDPAFCRAKLQEIVDKALPPLRALEERLRTEFEEPSRAEAKEQALARLVKETAGLLREQQAHERSYERAVNGLLKAQKERARSG